MQIKKTSLIFQVAFGFVPKCYWPTEVTLCRLLKRFALLFLPMCFVLLCYACACVFAFLCGYYSPFWNKEFRKTDKMILEIPCFRFGVFQFRPVYLFLAWAAYAVGKFLIGRHPEAVLYVSVVTGVLSGLWIISKSLRERLMRACERFCPVIECKD